MYAVYENVLKKLTNYWKIVAGVLLIVYLFSVMSGYLIYVRSEKKLHNERVNETELALKRTSTIFSDIIKDIRQSMFDNILNNNGVKRVIEVYDIVNLGYKDFPPQYIEKKLQEIRKSNPLVNQSVLISTSEDLVFSSQGPIKINYNQFKSSELYKKLKEQTNDTNIEYLESGDVFRDITNPRLLVIINKLSIDEGRKELGYLFTFIDINGLKTLCPDNFIGEIHILDGNKNNILENQTYLTYSDTKNVVSSINDYFDVKEIQVNNSSFLAGTAPIDGTDWSVLAAVPLDKLVTMVHSAFRMNFIAITPVLLISYFAIVLSIYFISKLMSSKEKTVYELQVSEELNGRLREYKHDFMNHLQIINGLLELNRPERAREYLKKIAQEGMDIKEQPNTGIPEIDSTLSAALADAKSKNIKVEVNPIDIHIENRNKIYDIVGVIANLIKNALYALDKYTGEEKELKVSISENTEEYIFKVSNNEPKIPEEIRKKIFDRGFTTKGSAGDGLGLYIVRKLLSRNNGSIELVVDEYGNHFIVKLQK